LKGPGAVARRPLRREEYRSVVLQSLWHHHLRKRWRRGHLVQARFLRARERAGSLSVVMG